jgi:hypothetical protein
MCRGVSSIVIVRHATREQREESGERKHLLGASMIFSWTFWSINLLGLEEPRSMVMDSFLPKRLGSMARTELCITINLILSYSTPYHLFIS